MNNSLQEFLSALGLNNEEIVLYHSLVEKGEETVLQLARNTGINRTKVYRLLEVMKQKGVIEDIVREHKQMITAAPISRLEMLLKKQEARTESLRATFPSVAELLAQHAHHHDSQTKVLYYNGHSGIEQMIWNTLRAKKELYGYTYRMLAEIGGAKLAAFWRDEWVKRGLIFKDIYSDEYLRSKKQNPQKDSIASPSIHFQSRYIPSTILDIQHQVDIYNNVVAYYNWHKGEVFGVEIYNQKVADLQKQLFQLVWNAAKAVKH